MKEVKFCHGCFLMVFEMILLFLSIYFYVYVILTDFCFWNENKQGLKSNNSSFSPYNLILEIYFNYFVLILSF